MTLSVRRIVMVAACVTLKCIAAGPQIARAADIGLLGSLAGMDCAAEETCIEEAITLHAEAGQRHRVRASGSALRVRSPEAVATTLAGAVRLGEEQVFRRLAGGDAGGSPGRPPGSGTGPPAGHSRGPYPVEAEESWVSGAGDLYLGLTSRVAGGGSRLFAFDLEADLKAPTASEGKGLGTGEWDFRAGAAAERRFWSLTLFGGMGWSRIGDPDWAELEDAPDAFIGVESEPAGAGLRWSGWLEGRGEIVEEEGAMGAIVVGCRQERADGWHAAARAGWSRSSGIYGVSMGWRWGGGRPTRREGGPGW